MVNAGPRTSMKEHKERDIKERVYTRERTVLSKRYLY